MKQAIMAVFILVFFWNTLPGKTVTLQNAYNSVMNQVRVDRIVRVQHVSASVNQSNFITQGHQSIEKAVQKALHMVSRLHHRIYGTPHMQASGFEPRNNTALLAKATGSVRHIGKVKRMSAGRPGKADMMVSPVQLDAIWQQMDIIMDKLDEIVEAMSP